MSRIKQKISLLENLSKKKNLKKRIKFKEGKREKIKFKARWAARHKALFDSIKYDTFDRFLMTKYKITPSDVFIRNKYNKTPLYYAVEKNRIHCVQYLLKLGANPNDKCIDGKTPMHIGFKQKHKIVF